MLPTQLPERRFVVLVGGANAEVDGSRLYGVRSRGVTSASASERSMHDLVPLDYVTIGKWQRLSFIATCKNRAWWEAGFHTHADAFKTTYGIPSR